MTGSFTRHWPEYLMEGALLALFMVSASVFGALLEYPLSPVHRAIANPIARRALMGLAMGLTAVALVYSPWGRRSGAHFNPAVTLTFLRLGKVARQDALFYIVAQFAGGVLGVILARAALGPPLAHPSVDYVVTIPGPRGAAAAFAAEFVISGLLMGTILVVSNHDRLMRSPGLFAGALVGLWILLEAPLSGMSMNPARTLGSAAIASVYTGLWIYFTAPPLGMLAAARAYRAARGPLAVRCAKLHHAARERCIFCGHPGEADAPRRAA